MYAKREKRMQVWKEKVKKYNEHKKSKENYR